VEELRAEEREYVQGDLAGAVLWLSDPDDLLLDVPGVESDSAECSAEVVPDLEISQPIGPDFVRLLPVCDCGLESCSECGGRQITAHTAPALWSAAQCCPIVDTATPKSMGTAPCAMTTATGRCPTSTRRGDQTLLMPI
jgi:hypothetical protein